MRGMCGPRRFHSGMIGLVIRPMKTPNQVHQSEGFTLLEVMMAAAVMALGLSTAIPALEMGYRALDTSRNTTIAAQLLQSTMETVRMLPYNAATGSSITSLENAQVNGAPTTVTIDPSFTSYDATAQAIVNRFTITQLITDVAGQTGLKKIVLTARWTGIDNRVHTLSYDSLYAQYGLYDYYEY